MKVNKWFCRKCNHLKFSIKLCRTEIQSIKIIIDFRCILNCWSLNKIFFFIQIIYIVSQHIYFSLSIFIAWKICKNWRPLFPRKISFILHITLSCLGSRIPSMYLSIMFTVPVSLLYITSTFQQTFGSLSYFCFIPYRLIRVKIFGWCLTFYLASKKLYVICLFGLTCLINTYISHIYRLIKVNWIFFSKRQYNYFRVQTWQPGRMTTCKVLGVRCIQRLYLQLSLEWHLARHLSKLRFHDKWTQTTLNL